MQSQADRGFPMHFEHHDEQSYMLCDLRHTGMVFHRNEVVGMVLSQLKKCCNGVPSHTVPLPALVQLSDRPVLLEPAQVGGERSFRFFLCIFACYFLARVSF